MATFNKKEEPPSYNTTTNSTNEITTEKPSEGTVVEGDLVSAGSQHLHRRLRGKEVQMLAVGGAIGTFLFVQMAGALPKGGPAGLLIGFIAYSSISLSVNQCFGLHQSCYSGMVCYLPIPSPFIALAGHWVDDALSFAMGWNLFLDMALGIPYEIVALNVLLKYWTDKVPVIAVVFVVMFIYAVLNALTVRYFGIAEFYMSIFKVILMIGLIFYTFVTMVGGNPYHDPYGFRYWNDPGAFVSYLVSGDTGRFCGVLAAMVQASFTMVGPEFIALTAAEAERPRKVMQKAFSSFAWRLMVFFIGSALCIGILVPYNDGQLSKAFSSDVPGGGNGVASPYVISMNHFNIEGLPDLVNAIIMTSVLSTGNNLVFSTSRILHTMATTGKAPRILAKCNKYGLPYLSVAVSLAFCLLALLQVSDGSAKVLNWLVGIITASYLLNYFGSCVTYLHFYYSLRRLGVDGDSLPYKRSFQPYTARYAVFGTFVMTLILGFDVFVHGHWDITSFFLDYTMVGFFVGAFVFWKVYRRTCYVRPGMADLQVGTMKGDIDVYEQLFEDVDVEESRRGPRGWRRRWLF